MKNNISERVSIVISVLFFTIVPLGGCFRGKVCLEQTSDNVPKIKANAGVASLYVVLVKRWPYKNALPNVEDMWGITAYGKRTDSIIYGCVPTGYEQRVKPQALSGGKLYMAEMHLDRGYPLLIHHVWFYVDESSAGKSSIRTLTPVTSSLEWQKGDRAFKEVDLVLDEVTGEILKIVPTEPTQ
jgi:hypothetical protein